MEETKEANEVNEAEKVKETNEKNGKEVNLDDLRIKRKGLCIVPTCKVIQKSLGLTCACPKDVYAAPNNAGQ